jgi:hypothetical protein
MHARQSVEGVVIMLIRAGLAVLATATVAVMTGCTGVSVGQGGSALSGGIVNLAGEAAIVVGRGAADVGNSVLDTVPFPGEPATAGPVAPPPSVPAPPMR